MLIWQVGFFNTKMKPNRNITVLMLDILARKIAKREGRIRALDAFGSTGVNGIRWKKEIDLDIDVVVNDLDTNVLDIIYRNMAYNEVDVCY